MELFDTLSYYMQNAQVRNALIVGVLVALCASLLGVTLVLKRFSFIGDGLSHVAFGAMAISSVTGVLVSAWKPIIDSTNNMIIVMPITVLSAVLLLRTGQNAKIRGDAAVAMISVGALAVGYLLMHLDIFPSNGNVAGDVCTTLFGASNILTLTAGDVTFCVVVSVLVMAAFVLLYNKLFAVTFDETFSRATGTRADLYNTLLAVLTAVTVVLGMRMMGALLISSLIIFPALSAMKLCRSFRSVILCAALISVVCFFFGMTASCVFETPSGASVVAADLIAFLFCSLFGRKS